MKTAHALAAVALALIVGAGVPPALAQAPVAAPAPQAARADKPHGPEAWFLGPMADRLKLTDAQKTAIKAVFDQHRPGLEANRKAVRAARHDLMEALGKPDTPEDTLKTLHRTASDLEFQGQLERRAMRREIRTVLTPDQREQVARMEGRMEGRREAMGRMGRMGRPWGPAWGGDGDAGGPAPMASPKAAVQAP